METEDAPGDMRQSRCDHFDYVASPPIHIVVGDTSAVHAEFFVHQSLICPRSEFFVKALGGMRNDHKERAVPLTDCNPEVVSQYIKLLYTDKLPSEDSVADASNTPDKYLALIKLYILVEKLMDETTKNMVIDGLFARAEECDDRGVHSQPSLLTIHTIYNDTPFSSEARIWLVDLYSAHTDVTSSYNLFSLTKELPREFLKDLVVHMIQVRPRHTQLTSLKDKLAQADEQLKKKTAEYESTKKDMITVNKQRDEAQNSKTAWEAELRQARAEVQP